MQQCRARIGVVAGLVGACLVSATAGAAEGDFEEIVVTGTRIVRPDFVSTSPIVSIDRQRLEEASTTTVEDVLNALPQFVPTYGSTSNNPDNGGQANLSLRGLPNTATLVLLDGRRLMPSNGNGVVDVNIVPPTLLESVEVITGGASAVYGSDAVAGVVNFKLRRDFEGLELDAMGAVTDHGDGGEYGFGIAAGTDFADGRGSVMGYAGYTERELVDYSARAFSRYGLVYVGPDTGVMGPRNAFVPGGSNTIEEGRVRLVANPDVFDSVFEGYGYAPGSVPYSQPLEGGRTAYNHDFGVNDDGTVFTLGALPNPVPGGVANYRGPREYPVAYNDRLLIYNFAPSNALQLPLERVSLFVRTDFEVEESIRPYAQALYGGYSVTRQLAPTPVQRVTIPVSNPYIPDDLSRLLASRSSPTTAEPFEFAKRMSALGPRVAKDDYEVYQVSVGVSGRVGSGWRYDAYLQWGESDDEERQSNNVDRSRYEELLYAPDGGASICGGYDPFGRTPISDECAAYVAVDGTNRTKVTQQIAEASASGPVWTLPAGEVQLVLGVMHKRDEYNYAADPISKSSDLAGFDPSDDVDGEDDNTDLYAEVSIPLLADLPAVTSLEAVLGYRWSDYASAGNVDAYKAELLYRPVDDVRVRGSFQHAVRAPSIYELYLPQLGPEVFVDGFNPDPCSIGTPERTGDYAAQVEALCVAQGLPAALLPTYSYTDFAVDGVTGGNPDLDVETADTFTAGVVVTSSASNRWLEGVQVSLDWYRIEVEDAIATVPAEAFVSHCYDVAFNPGFAIDNDYCTYFARDPVSGEIRDAKEIFRNIGAFRTSGIDLQVDWAVALGPGDASLNWLVGWVESFERQAGPGVEAEQLVGSTSPDIGGSLPEWKWNLRAAYAWSGAELAVQWRYIDALEDYDPGIDWRIPSRDYFDIFLAYRVDDGVFAGLSLHAGVENVTDVQPPIYATPIQANTDPSLYDTLGRRYFARATYRF